MLRAPPRASGLAHLAQAPVASVCERTAHVRNKPFVAIVASNAILRARCAQAVYELYSITPGPEWPPSGPRTSKLVIIGRNLNKQALADWFEKTSA